VHFRRTLINEFCKDFFHNPGLKRKVAELRCEICQINKHPNQQYSHLPARHADVAPWDSVAVDLIGPWKINISGREVEFSALTCIDPVTNLAELVRIDNKTSAHVAQHFENLWLSRYPKPNKCIFDQGGEFIGTPFRSLLTQHGIHASPTTSKNATANAICERMHLVIGNILRTRFNNHMAPAFTTAAQVVDNALAACCHAMRCAASKSLSNNTPGEVVFGRDMLLDLPVIVDLLLIRDKRQLLINDNLRRTNSKRREFDYHVNQEVLLKASSSKKLDIKAEGPFRITQVYTNGTVEIQLTPTVRERLNVRRLIPFRRRQV
jgi:transposase InsO family protein